MIALIYARKSRATEKGESIEHQIEKGKSYCKSMDWGYEIYIDYDYSGGSTKRPEFEKMIKKIKSNSSNYCALICYKLARVCRNMVDFVNLYEFLSENGLDFISISEKFDTHTTFGRAYMYMAAIFAQMERENIQEQVSDNMHYRAKKGKWNGGPVPIGYDALKVEENNIKGKKVASKLIINEQEAEIIKFIYDEYINGVGSIRGITKKLLLNGYKTKTDGLWRDNQVARVLKTAIYCIADEDAFEYFNSKSNLINITEDDNNIKQFDGSHGLLYYGRRKPKNETTTKPNDKENWILSIGEHEGIIPGVVFVKAQRKLSLNKAKNPRLGTSTKSPLTGLVRCKKCGSPMTIVSSKKNKKEEGYSYIYFECRKKNETSSVLCSAKRINARKLEESILEELSMLFQDKDKIDNIIKSHTKCIEKSKANNQDVENKKKLIMTEIKNIDKNINNLINAVANGTLPANIVKSKFEELEKSKEMHETELAKIKLNQYENDIKFNVAYISETINKIIMGSEKIIFAETEFNERKAIYRDLIKCIYVDDKDINIELLFSTDNNLLVCTHMDMDSSMLPS